MIKTYQKVITETLTTIDYNAVDSTKGIRAMEYWMKSITIPQVKMQLD